MEEFSTLNEERHSDDLQDVISKPPSWLLKRGISFIFFTIMLIIGLSIFIRYPEMVKSSIRFNTNDAPKVIINKVDGNLIKLLFEDGDVVNSGANLAYLESTADHTQVLMLLDSLQQLRKLNNKNYNLEDLISPFDLNLGELQGSYQTLYLSYLNYKSTSIGGVFQERKNALRNEIINVQKQYEKSKKSFALQSQQLQLAEEEFEKYKILADKKVISPFELREKEAILLAKRQYIPEMESSLINYDGSILTKNRELSDLANQISDEQKKYIQAMNSFISEAENWKKKYVLTSNASGKLIYGSFLQENQPVKMNQELFFIITTNDNYYGELLLPQNVSAKVKKNQKVLIKVNSYPYEEYGYLTGKVNYISDIPLHDSVFFIRVEILRTKEDSLIKLKPGIKGDAEIITEEQSVFKRILFNLTKNLKY